MWGTGQSSDVHDSFVKNNAFSRVPKSIPAQKCTLTPGSNGAAECEGHRTGPDGSAAEEAHYPLWSQLIKPARVNNRGENWLPPRCTFLI